VSECQYCGEKLNGVEHDPYTCISNLQVEVKKLSQAKCKCLGGQNCAVVLKHQSENAFLLAENTIQWRKLKEIKSIALPLYQEMRREPYKNLSSYERRAYAIIQAIVGDRES